MKNWLYFILLLLFAPACKENEASQPPTAVYPDLARTFQVVDQTGGDLLDQTNPDNLLKSIRIAYNGETYTYQRDEEHDPSEKSARPLALRWGRYAPSEDPAMSCYLTFGDFEPEEQLVEAEFTLDWGNGTTNRFELACYIDERGNVKRSLKMDGSYQAHTGNEDWFVRIEKEIEKEPEDPADEPGNPNRPDAKSVVEEMLRNYGNYDPEKAEELLTGKRWELWFWLEYDSSWSDIYKHFFFYGETYYTGFSIDHYTLHANGTLLHEYESLGGYVEKEGKWSFDPETRILQLPDKAVCIEALSHNRILWQEERIYLPSEIHYDRRIFKAVE